MRAGRRDRMQPRIELRDVTFATPTASREVLHDCSVTIEPGESVAIVGPSGCGKTTLLKLMLGIHAPRARRDPGRRRAACSSWVLRAWREMIGTVMQDDQLFARLDHRQHRFFDSNPDVAWVRECARLAAVHDEIEALPMGYHTLVGDMGASLSGGQKQRILLARALYKRPHILFLDEATSALDVDRERLVNQAIRQPAAHARDRCAPAGDDRSGHPRGRAERGPRGAGPARARGQHSGRDRRLSCSRRGAAHRTTRVGDGAMRWSAVLLKLRLAHFATRKAPMRYPEDIRCDRGRRRPCRHRGGACRCAHGLQHAAAHAQHRNPRADELQPVDRRHRQGPSRQGSRCAGRRDGGCHR